MKRHLDHFNHPSNSHDDSRIKYLRAVYGWEGEGRYYALKGIIARSENCILNLSESSDASTLANTLGLRLSETNEFLRFLKIEAKLVVEIQPKLFSIPELQSELILAMSNRLKWRLNKIREKRIEGETIKEHA